MKRSPGNHVSEIINRLCVNLGKFKKREEDEGPPQIQFEVGNCVETAIAEGLAKRFAADCPGRYIHGVELELDGVTGNIDLLDTVDFAVEEVKSTKYSLSRLNKEGIEGDTFWHYWMQLKAYCWMIGTDVGRLHVVFINGNYKYDGGPETGWQYRVWEERWSRKELVECWRMIVGHKRV